MNPAPMMHVVVENDRMSKGAREIAGFDCACESGSFGLEAALAERANACVCSGDSRPLALPVALASGVTGFDG